MDSSCLDNLVDFTIIIPIYNGSCYIKSFCLKAKKVLKKTGKKYELIFVDDGSTDNTYADLLDEQKKDASFKVIRLTLNQGQQLALTQGLKQATGKVVIIMDDDQEFALDYIDAILDKIKEGYDFVLLWRQNRNIFIFRKICSWAIGLLISAMVQKRIHDFGGIKAFGNQGASLLYERSSVLKMIKQLKCLTVSEIKINDGSCGYSRYSFKKLLQLFFQILGALIKPDC